MSEVVTKNDLLKILDKLPSMVLPNTTTVLAPAIGEGNVHILQVGKMVIVSGLIATTEEIPAGSTLVSGVPTTKVNNAAFVIIDSNRSTDCLFHGFVNNSNNIGALKNKETMAAPPSGNGRSLRFTVAYIAS